MSWCVKYTQDFRDLKKKKECKELIKQYSYRASLVVKWLGVHWSMQGHGFDPWSRKIPHGAEQLSLCTTTAEARVPGAGALQQEKPLFTEARERPDATTKKQTDHK